MSQGGATALKIRSFFLSAEQGLVNTGPNCKGVDDSVKVVSLSGVASSVTTTLLELSVYVNVMKVLIQHDPYNVLIKGF